MASSESPPRRRGFVERLAGIADNIGSLAEAVTNVVSSAGELLVDTDLRRKGANYLVHEAARNVNDIQKGAESLQQGAKARFDAGASKITGLLRNIERQIQEFQKQQQQRDLQAELDHHHKLPVDIQIGDEVFEDMSQELRSRFWYVLLERPDLAKTLMKRNRVVSRPVTSNNTTVSAAPSVAAAAVSQPRYEADAATLDSGQARSAPAAADVSQNTAASTAGESSSTPTSPGQLQTPFAQFSHESEIGSNSHAAANAAEAAAADPTGHAQAETAKQQQEQQQNQAGTKDTSAVPAGSAKCTQNSVPDIDDLLSRQSTGVIVPSEDPAGVDRAAVISSTAAGCSDKDAACTSCPPACLAAAAASSSSGGVPVAADPWDESTTSAVVAAAAAAPAAAGSNGNGQSSSPGKPVAPSPWIQAADGDDQSGGSTMPQAAAATQPGTQSQPTAAAAAEHARSAGDEWELVSSDVPAAAVGGEQVEAIVSLQALVQDLSGQESIDQGRVAQQAVFQAMLEVPWIPNEGIPQEIDQHGEYARLLAAGCGHVEDVIMRDVARTFPEHPLFSAHLQGQQRLLRLLKAYAAADPEVGYCQGMAFAAGVLLMYLPEEPAFRLYYRMMTTGPQLRRLYLPGLDVLKLELSRFELLMATHYPQLHQHLLEAGLPALLYAAQWFMTTFSCPFPLHVAARVLDILLQSDSDAILSQLALAVMGALQQELLEVNDFEALITHLKVQPLSWPIHTHRQVLNEALSSPATEAELQAAAATVAAEASRLGRFSSFSDKRLTRAQGGVKEDTAGCSTLETISQDQHAAQMTHNHGILTVQGSSSLAPGCVSSGSASFSQLEAALYDLDLDMIMPAVQSEEGSDPEQ